jgi:aspartyl-tRNA synthetase
LEVAFIPVADHSGFTQLTLDKQRWKEVIADITSETVIRASGVVQARPERDQRQVGNA